MNRQPNPVAFISTMKNIWAVINGVDITNVGRNLYQIQFYHWRDKQKVLLGQPWHFDKFPLLLEEFDKVVKPSDLVIFKLPLWARFYDIPFRDRGNDANAKTLGNKIGEFLDAAKSSRYGMENRCG